MGREGHCRQISLVCVGSTHSVPATVGLPPLMGLCFPHLHCSDSWLLHMERALRCMRFQFSGIPQKRRLGWACVLCLPQPEQLRQPRSLSGILSPGVVRLIPSTVPASVSAGTSRVHVPCVYSWELALAATLLADIGHPESQEVFG